MSWSDFIFRFVNGLRKVERGTQSSGSGSFWDRSRVVALGLFCVTVASIVAISYVGVSTVNLPVLPGQVATVRVTASVPFTFVSSEQTRITRERLQKRVPPIYRLEFAPYHQFESHLHEFLDAVTKFEHDFPANLPSLSNREQALKTIVDNLNSKGPYRVRIEDVSTVIAAGDAKYRRELIDRSLVVLNEIYKEGTHDQSLAVSSRDPGSVMVFQIQKSDGEIAQRPVQSLEEALIFLRVNLTAEGMPRELALALFRIFRNGLTPNLVFDYESTRRREQEAVKTLRPVVLQVEKGQTIIEPGTRVTPEQFEMLTAHRQTLQERGDTIIEEGLHLFGRILLVLAMVAACALYIRIEDPETLQSNGRLALLALVVILNLAMVRLGYSLLNLDFFIHHADWASTLPYLAPTSFAAIILVVLIDAGSAIFIALFISLFTGVIYGNRLDVQVITFLASIVAIHRCRDVRRRGSVVNAAASGGLVVCCFALMVGLAEQAPLSALAKQMAAGLLTGVMTGMAVVGLLPVLESLFKRTTDITLLELTDFNHPLLRLMQLEAPGTYHHSLVVAQLTENAAAAIGANPLLARVCALFHDIGKTKSADYFNENQNDHANPHDRLLPEESARIIRQHVEDGLELAQKHRLPKAVCDAIRQHHGTTLIRYFYVLACQQAEKKNPASLSSAAPNSLDEAPFRYQGPKPQTRESAILALADSVEAASRSLKTITPETLDHLIGTLVAERMMDGQLEEAPLTFAELSKIKQSFSFTLLNMLHSRIEYPKMQQPSEKVAK